MRAGILVLLLLALPFASADTEVASLEEGATAELVWSGLAMPVDIAFGPDGTLYYAEFESGNLRAIPPGASEPAAKPLWTAPDLQLGGERGFVGLGVPPDFAQTGTFYVYYQHNKTDKVVSRFSKVVDGTETVLIDDITSGPLHNSGRIAFTPDGLVLLSVGDAVLDTAGPHKAVHAHDPEVLNGKILRLTRDGAPAPDNPWQNEVWTKGHRNVYGLAVSPEGVVLATENGPDRQDELNLLEGGGDYGWPTCVGPCDASGDFVDPILSYEETIAPTGAAWWNGHFYFTDFNEGRLHRVREAADGTWVDERVLKFTTPRILDVEAGPDGLYLSTWDSVWRVVPAAIGEPPATAPPTPPPDEEAPPTPSATPPTATQPVDGEGAIGSDVPAGGALLAVAALALVARGRR